MVELRHRASASARGVRANEVRIAYTLVVFTRAHRRARRRARGNARVPVRSNELITCAPSVARYVIALAPRSSAH
jgi:hypothetical protein